MFASFFSAVALTFLAGAGAQSSLHGVVRDAVTGEPLAGAVVLLGDLDRGVLTDRAGRYRIGPVPPGPQHMTVRQLGYASRTLHVLVPRTGGLELDVALEPRPFALAGMVVSPAPAVRGVDPGEGPAYPERTISAAALRQHPTLAGADAFRALGGGEVVLDPEAGSGVHIRGGATDHTAYLVDGIPVLNPYHAAGLVSGLNSDALAGLSVHAAAPGPELPEALSGVVAASTREPGPRARARSTLSTVEGRVTVDGPVGRGGAGYLLGFRWGVPGLLQPEEGSYLAGAAHDLLAKLQLPALRGGLRVLVYDSENEIDAAGTVPSDSGSEPVARNRFGWASRSVGVAWRRPEGEHAFGVAEVAAWRAEGSADAVWQDTPTTRMSSRRRDHGVRLSLARARGGSRSEVGVRFHQTTTRYRAEAATPPAVWTPEGVVRVGTLFGSHTAELAPGVTAWTAAGVSTAGGPLRISPRIRVRWSPPGATAWTVALSRTHQYVQSLRNPESPVGLIFPADPFLGAGVSGVPVPRSDQAVLAGEWVPADGIRIAGQAYARAMDDLVLVAPDEPGPFATSAVGSGSAEVRGVAAELAARGARYGVVVSYAWQRVRFRHDDLEYTPRHGSAHLVDAGMVVFPRATASVRVGVSVAAGRRGTLVAGPFEWEACNVLDRGCEFAGSPRLAGAPGELELPAYVRMDLGARKHWHLRLRGRDALVGLFGTVTNVLGRRNTLARVVTPDGEVEPVEMLPLAPLVVGLDVRF